MNKLELLAADIIRRNNTSLDSLVSSVFENMSDIQLYLRENKEQLPDNSEVKIEELFSLVNASIESIEGAVNTIYDNQKILTALIENK